MMMRLCWCQDLFLYVDERTRTTQSVPSHHVLLPPGSRGHPLPSAIHDHWILVPHLSMANELATIHGTRQVPLRDP